MIRVSITKFPGETRTFTLEDGSTVADAARLAQISLDQQEIRVNEERVTASYELSDDDDVLINKVIVSQRS
jgi:hypothetical protein